MEQVHGVDVSWMTRGSPRDKIRRTASYPSPAQAPAPSPAQPRTVPSPTPNPRNPEGTAAPTPNDNINIPPQSSPPTTGTASPKKLNGGNGSPQRRNSWFSNISAKFSGSSIASPSSSPPHANSNHHVENQQEQTPSQAQDSQHAQSQPQQQLSSSTADAIMPKLHAARNAVLPHAMKPEGNGPYIPAPPKSGQAGLLGVFRRLSSSGTGGLAAGKLAHGLVERKTLNVDPTRRRCPISELKDAKLRRVSFCVDVEIAPMPKYADAEVAQKPVDKTSSKKWTEKGEGEALKKTKSAEALKEADQVTDVKSETDSVQSETPKTENGDAHPDSASPPEPEKDTSKKKEKKKKSEEERKARKEKRRRLAEDNGTVPIEICYDDSDSSDIRSCAGTPNMTTTSQPTTNPTRIYRRCCQLRETPVLKKITEQLLDGANSCSKTGVVNKLDLTDYWLQLADLVTLGDYLAVVPVRELILENTGLGDEGLRVIMSGLLAVRRPCGVRRRKLKLDSEEQGGVVERLVLKNNKLGPDGWKHISLFLYMCRSLKYLDISQIAFPKQTPFTTHCAMPNGKPLPRAISDIFSRALADRLGGSTLEMLNLGETEPTMDQLATILDGVVKCGVPRLGLAHNHIDKQGVEAVAKYLATGKCEGLDLGGNDLRDHMGIIAGAIRDKDPLWALSLAGCNLRPSSLCRMMPSLVRLENFRFIDLSHNHDLFELTPSAVGLLRKYLPQFTCLKRVHLQDVNMSAEQAIALVEILPEVCSLAHINLLGNAALVKLAGARTEEAQEEACALYASLLAASRVSNSLICVDIEVPGDEAGEIVKAMAKQVVAYCLRNMERIPDTNISAAVASALTETQNEVKESKLPAYPDVLVHLVGHDVMDRTETPEEDDSAPDEDYVIGGTGVVKALKCCLENRGDDSGRDFEADMMGEAAEQTEASPRTSLAAGGKAKDMSKHLLAGARKIRVRLQPALNKAMLHGDDEITLRKLTFLDETLQGIIKRFEDEFPDTREPETETGTEAKDTTSLTGCEELPSPPAAAGEDSAVAVSDGEDESEIHPPKPVSRSNSIMSKVLAEEEGRILREGHRFRSGFVRQEQLDLLSLIDDIGAHPKHAQMLEDLAEDLGGEMLEKVKEKGVVRAFQEDKDILFRRMKESDPDHWERFVESQHKARANINVSSSERPSAVVAVGDENAISD
ncbi:hypothetical protein HIM_02095 [Hirsutella minnesotensis 3608]|nr:hypothetical protein HIM_02095 [Hirsutella minnesotensis 3608]